MEKNDNFTALQSMQGILHITALQPCEFLPLLKTFFHSAMSKKKLQEVVTDKCPQEEIP